MLGNLRPIDATLAVYLPVELFSSSDDTSLTTPIRAWLLPRDDLFTNVRAALTEPDSYAVQRSLDSHALQPIALFVIGPDLAITLNRNTINPAMFQCFLSRIRRMGVTACDSTVTLNPILVDASAELTVWTRQPDVSPQNLSRIWKDLSDGRSLNDFEVATTPKLYGNKLRLTDFISGVVATFLQDGTPILDLMSGSGVVTRTLASRHPVTANDPNAYAALLTRAQAWTADEHTVAALLRDLRIGFEENLCALRSLAQAPLDEEAVFLHGESDESSLERYREFCKQPVLPLMERPTDGAPYQMFTARYANVYFGISQCAEIDSLRASIDANQAENGPMRDLCLAALVIALSICNPGPHFAQPRMLTSVKALRDITERRSRSILWEFELALARLTSRPPLAWPIGPVTQKNWPEALRDYVELLGGQRPAAVYVDPPYSKLQYSRYYHILNSVIGYSYPTIEGTGRYPPRSERFSSKLEYQPHTARRELEAIASQCAANNLYLFLSYGDTGFVPIDDLAKILVKHFNRSEVFFDRLRHHSQGKPLSNARSIVTEYVMVATPSG